MRRILLVGLVAAGLLAVPAHAEPKMVVLGTDPQGDAAPGTDLTLLSVGRAGKDLRIEIGIFGILPVLGGYGPLQGVQWTFDVKKRTFVAEAYPLNPGQFGFSVFEMKEDGSFEQLGNVEGTYDSADGFISMLVPLQMIGAKRGTVISGTGEPGTQDVDVHFHLGLTDYYPDYLTTERDYRVP